MKPARESASRSRATSPASAATAPSENSRPTTAARWSTARSAGASAAEAACEHGFERGRQPFAAFGRKRCELLDVERVPLGELDDPLACLVVHLRGAGDDRARLVLTQRAQRERVAQRPLQLRAGEAEHEQRCVGAVGQVVDQVDERRLRPVDVVEHEQDGLLSGEGLEQPADGPVRLPERRRLRAFGQRAQPSEHEVGVRLSLEGLLRLRPAQRSQQGQEGGAVAVREAACDEHRRLPALAERELAREARLADPGLADDGDDAAAAGLTCGCERGAEACQLLVAAHERRVEASLGSDERGGSLVELDPARAGELDGAGDDGSGSLDDLAGGDPGRQAQLAGSQHSAHGVVVRRRLRAEDGDEPFRAKPLEYAAVTLEHVPHRRERLVEPLAILLRVVGGRRCRCENGHKPELSDLAGGRGVRYLGGAARSGSCRSTLRSSSCSSGDGSSPSSSASASRAAR